MDGKPYIKCGVESERDDNFQSYTIWSRKKSRSEVNKKNQKAKHTQHTHARVSIGSVDEMKE